MRQKSGELFAFRDQPYTPCVIGKTDISLPRGQAEEKPPPNTDQGCGKYPSVLG